MPTANYVKETACPKCRAEGHDKDGTNLIVYSDGYTICYRYHGILSKGGNNHESLIKPIEAPREYLEPYCTHLSPIRSASVIRFLWQFDIGYLEWERHQLQEIQQGVCYTKADSASWITEGVYVPVHPGFLVRRIEPKGRERKVLASSNIGHYSEHLWELLVNTLIIVEDVFSAIRLHKYGYNVFCLLGSSVNNAVKERLGVLLDGADKCLIWTDSDEAGDKAADKLLAYCAYFCYSKRIRTDKDPKWYGQEDVNQFILEASYVNN